MKTLIQIIKFPVWIFKVVKSIAHAIRTGDWSEGED